MGLLSASFEINLAPETGLGRAWTIVLVLTAAYIATRGTVALGDTITKLLRPTLLVFFGAAVIMAYTNFREEGNERVRLTIEGDSVSSEAVPGAFPDFGNDGDSFTNAPLADHTHHLDDIPLDGLAPHSHP